MTIKLREGEKFRTCGEVETLYLTSYRAPYTGGGKAVLPAGFEFEVMHDQVDGAPGVNCRALEYERYEQVLVSRQEMADDKYAGYHIVMRGDVIASRCVPIDSDT